MRGTLYCFVLLLFTSCACFNMFNGEDVTKDIANTNQNIVKAQKDIDEKSDKLAQNNVESKANVEKITDNNEKINESAKVIRNDIQADVDVADETKNSITTKANDIIAMSQENRRLLTKVRDLTLSNANLINEVQSANKEILEASTILSKINDKNIEWAKKYHELSNENEKLLKDRLYLIIIIGVIGFGVSVAFMMNPETTRWGKFGAVASFITTAVALALVYYGKVGAIVSGVALLIFGIYIFKNIRQATGLNTALDEQLEIMERGKFLMDDNEEKRIFGKDEGEVGEANANLSTKTNLIVNKRIGKAKEKIHLEFSEEEKS